MARGKYQEWLEEENLILLKSWAMDGLTDKQIAENIGINRKTLYEWKNKYDLISDALKRGKVVFDCEAEQALHKAGIGYFVEEVETYITETNGVQTKRIKKNKKWVPPNVTALIFWLKNRQSDKWKDRKAVEETNFENKEMQKYFELLDKEMVNDG